MSEFQLGDRVLVLRRLDVCFDFKPWYEGDVSAVSKTALRVSQPLRWWGKNKWILIISDKVKVEKVSA